MGQDILVWFPLAVLLDVIVFGIWSEVVAGFEMGEVALDVAGGAATAWGGETDVGRHISMQLRVDRTGVLVVGSAEGFAR